MIGDITVINGELCICYECGPMYSADPRKPTLGMWGRYKPLPETAEEKAVRQKNSARFTALVRQQLKEQK